MQLLTFAVASTLFACPFTAHADDEPAPADPWAAPATDETAPVVAEAELAPPSAAPVVAPVENHGWCHHGGWNHGAWKHAGWSWRSHEPRFAIGYAKGHLELDDTDDKTTQKSLIGRVVLHRGFELELELAKIETGGDTTHTHGAALLKTF